MLRKRDKNAIGKKIWEGINKEDMSLSGKLQSKFKDLKVMDKISMKISKSNQFYQLEITGIYVKRSTNIINEMKIIVLIYLFTFSVNFSLIIRIWN